MVGIRNNSKYCYSTFLLISFAHYNSDSRLLSPTNCLSRQFILLRRSKFPGRYNLHRSTIRDCCWRNSNGRKTRLIIGRSKSYVGLEVNPHPLFVSDINKVNILLEMTPPSTLRKINFCFICNFKKKWSPDPNELLLSTRNLKLLFGSGR